MKMEWTEKAVLEALAGVIDPELSKDVVTLGWVTVRSISEQKIDVEVKTGNPAMHARQRMDEACLLYTSPSPRDRTRSRMPSSA